jgi:hypothetical protein
MYGDVILASHMLSPTVHAYCNTQARPRSHGGTLSAYIHSISKLPVCRDDEPCCAYGMRTVMATNGL